MNSASSSKPQLAIVILNWNGSTMLSRYLPSVLRDSQGEATVYVADNASTDDSVPMLRQQFPQVQLILLDRNWGFAEGYNRALATIDAEYYLLLNSDIETTPGWLTPMLSFMEAHRDVAVCQPKLRSMAHRDQFEYAGASGGFIDRLGYPYCRGRVFNTVEQDNGQYDNPAEVHWATGAALMVRASVYRQVGGLDARFFAHQEEIDMCWRIRLLGHKIYCLPSSVVYHVGGGTLPKANPMKTFLNFRNNLTMLYKCLPDEELKPVMRRRWWLDYLAASQMLLLNFNWGDFRAVWRARRAFKQWKNDFEADRKAIQEAVFDANHAKPAPFSLLWQYYIKRHKRYTDLPASLPDTPSSTADR
ncbi:MAG: glycosyltransferase family 2 protein [Prevotella sp.]|nr:glycosyltransferase family 2 protein [Prevotella sp.]